MYVNPNNYNTFDFARRINRMNFKCWQFYVNKCSVEKCSKCTKALVCFLYINHVVSVPYKKD